MTHRIAVTGASGFLGKHLCESLLREGYDVVPVSRSSRLVAGIAPVTVPSLGDRASIARAFSGVDAVVHLAARVHVMQETAADPLGAFRRTNVEDTRVLCEEVVRCGVRRVVFVSTSKVLGEGGARPYSEADVPAPLDPYAQSKLEAEQVVRETVLGPASWTIVRPPLVYGPGVSGNFRRLIGLANLARRVPLPLGHIRNRRSMVGVHNLAAALTICVVHPGGADRTYLISDGEDLSTSQLLELLAAALGSPARLFHFSAAPMLAVARLLGRGAEAQRLLGSLQVDASLIRHELGWSPAVTVREEIEAVAQWWRGMRRPC